MKACWGCWETPGQDLGQQSLTGRWRSGRGCTAGSRFAWNEHTFDKIAGMEPVVPEYPAEILKLWVDGELVSAPGATLNRSGDAWAVEANLASHNPFARGYGLSLQLADGRTAHGRAELAAVHGERLVFRLSGPLQGTL